MTKLTIQTQYFENYNVGPDGFNTYGDGLPHWKPKGGHEFVITDFEADYLMYDETRTVEALKALVAKQETVAERFEYISHELTFSEPSTINNSEFLTAYKETKEVENV